MGFQTDDETEKIVALKEPKRKENSTHKGVDRSCEEDLINMENNIVRGSFK